MPYKFINNTASAVTICFLSETHLCEPRGCVLLDIPKETTITLSSPQQNKMISSCKFDKELKPFGWAFNRHCHGFLSLAFSSLAEDKDVTITVCDRELPIWDRFYRLRGHFVSFAVSSEEYAVEDMVRYKMNEGDVNLLIRAHLLAFLGMLLMVALLVSVGIWLLFKSSADDPIGYSAIGVFILALVVIKQELVDWIRFVKKLKKEHGFLL